MNNENNNNNNNSRILIIAIVLILIVACVGYYEKVKKVEKNQVASNIQVNNNEIVNQNKDENVNSNEQNTTEKYKDVKWCGTEANIKNTMFLKIENGKLIFTMDGEASSYTMKNGTPKSVDALLIGGIPEFYILTTEGKVYYLLQDGEDFKIIGEEIVESLKNYTIKDMGSIQSSVVGNPIYFLTEEGNLIDFEGNKYEDINLDFVASFGNFYPLYFNKDGIIRFRDYSNEEELVYITVREDNNKNAVANKVFWQFSTIHNNLSDDNISERYAIITESNNLVFVTDNGDVMVESQKVDSYEIDRILDEEWDTYRYNVVIKMQDGSKITLVDTSEYYYDMDKKDTLSLR